VSAKPCAVVSVTTAFSMLMHIVIKLDVFESSLDKFSAA
jgi:hypothetical protein